MDSLLFLYIFYFISIFLYVLTVIVTTAFVIPLQVKQAFVRNGLAILRRQLLFKGVLSLIVALVSILALTSRYFIDGELNRYVIVILILIHSTSTFGKSVIDLIVYHQQYSPENKLRHEKIEKMEEGGE